MHNKSELLSRLRFLGLSADEARMYLELLRGALTPLQLSRKTGIERTRVYRLISSLEKRSLITRHTDERGLSLVAADPSTLEVDIVAGEEMLKQQRSVFDEVLPSLEKLQTRASSLFNIRTYEGHQGMRQMAWHDLRAEGELLILGGGLLEAMTGSRSWAERYRGRVAELGFPIRCLSNKPESDIPTSTKSTRYLELYQARAIPREVLDIDNNQITIYNDTVAIYHWRENQKVGLEVINSTHAKTMRQAFEICWKLADTLSDTTTIRATRAPREER